MLDLATTTQFRKDLKRIRKRGYDLSKLDCILQKLRAEEPLPEKNRDHDLIGDYNTVVPDLSKTNLPLGVSTRREILTRRLLVVCRPHL